MRQSYDALQLLLAHHTQQYPTCEISILFTATFTVYHVEKTMVSHKAISLVNYAVKVLFLENETSGYCRYRDAGNVLSLGAGAARGAVCASGRGNPPKTTGTPVCVCCGQW